MYYMSGRNHGQHSYGYVHSVSGWYILECGHRWGVHTVCNWYVLYWRCYDVQCMPGRSDYPGSGIG